MQYPARQINREINQEINNDYDDDRIYGHYHNHRLSLDMCMCRMMLIFKPRSMWLSGLV